VCPEQIQAVVDATFDVMGTSHRQAPVKFVVGSLRKASHPDVHVVDEVDTYALDYNEPSTGVIMPVKRPEGAARPCDADNGRQPGSVAVPQRRHGVRLLDAPPGL
jgi:hypothetical protein